MPKYLKHRVNGVIYPFNLSMSKHPEMDVFEEPDPQFAEAKEKSAAPAEATSEVQPFKRRKKRATKAEMAAREASVNNSDDAA